jgi:hypothetical protein
VTLVGHVVVGEVEPDDIRPLLREKRGERAPLPAGRPRHDDGAARERELSGRRQPCPCSEYGFMFFSRASRVSGWMPSSVAEGMSAGGKDSVIDIGIDELR